MDTTVLEELGLSNAEARIYLALLELGSSKTGRLIDNTKLQSSTVYHILGSLVTKGLVTYIFVGKVKYYRASSPETLQSFLDDKKRKLNSILPELKAKETQSSNKQAARVYEGIEGIRAAYDDIIITLKPGEEYCFFQVPGLGLMKKEVSLFFRNYHLRRSESGIRVRGIAVRDSQPILNMIMAGVKNTQIRYLKEYVPMGLTMYKNKIIIFDVIGPLTAVVIESKSIYESYQRFFEDKWKEAKP